ncbi:hypothetical protein BKA67DRAFT_537804 [Truncatella angustata]|uniref:Uncharacterized protein n=1 Tax=Truncatella angustata TaxID=152316 RepID=A0A9P8UGL4_9PEZI|nr:uncharacterized protein BKA67DRAFT_537804 [Truncatella angustata]KAH6651952.1 hypothetical protein BKA67DRAFT_537804 [Truncatella angustata]
MELPAGIVPIEISDNNCASVVAALSRQDLFEQRGGIDFHWAITIVLIQTIHVVVEPVSKAIVTICRSHCWVDRFRDKGGLRGRLSRASQMAFVAMTAALSYKSWYKGGTTEKQTPLISAVYNEGSRTERALIYNICRIVIKTWLSAYMKLG